MVDTKNEFGLNGDAVLRRLAPLPGADAGPDTEVVAPIPPIPLERVVAELKAECEKVSSPEVYSGKGETQSTTYDYLIATRLKGIATKLQQFSDAFLENPDADRAPLLKAVKQAKEDIEGLRDVERASAAVTMQRNRLSFAVNVVHDTLEEKKFFIPGILPREHNL